MFCYKVTMLHREEHSCGYGEKYLIVWLLLYGYDVTKNV